MSDNFYYDKSFVLKDLELLSSTGQSIDLTNVMLKLTIFEDLYNSTISGEVTIGDGNDLLSKMPILGFEYLRILLNKPNSADVFSKTFRIYKIDNVTADFKSQKYQEYSLRFCSPEMLLSISSKISKSYRGKTIDEMVLNILREHLLASSKITLNNIEKTTNKHDLIIPFWSPFKAIEWLTKRTDIPFFFFENDNGYNFKSIDSLVSTNPTKKYFFAPQNINLTRHFSPSEKNEVDFRESNVIKYEFINFVDVMNSISNGMFASSLKTFDPIRLKVEDNIFNYDNTFKITNHLDKTSGKFHNNAKDFFTNDKKVNENFGSLKKFYPSTKNHNIDKIISGKQPNINPNNVERWLLQRISKLTELNYFRIKLLVPGDNIVTVGDTIEFMMPQLDFKERGEDNLHPYFRGKYLITAVRHMITNKSYEMLLEGVKDGVFKSYPVAGGFD
jgi:hypothetical protein